MSEHAKPMRLFLVAGEHSGDNLGAGLMAALTRGHAGPIEFAGVGGEAMAAQGLRSLFALSDIAVMGVVGIARRLPVLIKRVHACVDAIIAANPDCVVLIDAPEFNLPIARRVRARAPHLPIIKYVSPSVWAWRPGRARAMAPHIDHILALLPFEPAVHLRLGGPACTYVGHPIATQITSLRALDGHELRARLGIAPEASVLTVLPGSRTSEASRLLPVFGAAVALLAREVRPLEVLIPTVPHLKERIAAATASWPVRTHLLTTDDDKFAAFATARAALAASGTVTLELAAAGTPMVVAYKVDRATAVVVRRLIKAQSIVLANLVLGYNAFPEFIQQDCTAQNLAGALESLLRDGPERADQLAALAQIPSHLAPSGVRDPSDVASDIVRNYARHGRVLA